MALIYHIIALLGGLAMFLYGMRVMGDGLKANSGGAMKSALAKVTNQPVFGFLLGMLVTCVIQSSTATIVLTVGLVGAGFLTFHQSIGIVLGANVGTAITAQIIRLMDIDSAENSLMYFFKADNLAPLALIIGMVILMTTNRESKRNMGNVACGFGVLFMGLIFMSDAVSVFGDSLSGLLTAFSNNYFLGFLAGVLVTGVIQSSSAVVGIIQSIASSVGVTFNGVFAVIIGVNIGDCLTTYLVSAIGARKEQIRTATVHVVYNVFAAVLLIVLLVIGRSTGLISDHLWYESLNSGGVANLHGLFRLIPALCLLPFSGSLEKITMRLVPEEKEKVDNSIESQLNKKIYELDPHLITSPIMALDEVSELLQNMADVCYANYLDASSQIFSFNPNAHTKIDEREQLIDHMTDATGQYLVSLNPYIKRDRDFRRQNYLLKCCNSLERIGDNAQHLLETMTEMHALKKEFSEEAKGELKLILEAEDEILTLTMDAFRTNDLEKAKKIEPLEEVIDDLADDLNSRHIFRLSRHLCAAEQGMQFQKILNSLTTISDMCSDIAVYMTELTKESVRGHEHEYIHQLHHSVDTQFQKDYQDQREKYFSRLMEIEEVPNTDGLATEE